MDEIISKYGQLSWAELSEDEKEQWLTENLNETEFEKYEMESRGNILGQNTASGIRTMKKKVGRKRKITRRRRYKK